MISIPYQMVWPIVRRLSAERAHGLAIMALRCGFVAPSSASVDPNLRTTVFGLDFKTPVGLAAGFDKSADAIAPLMKIGLGAVEVGSVTPKPQSGNPKPRLFRLEEDRAVINRMGFNNDGAGTVEQRIKALPRPLGGVLGINLGKNKTTEDAVADYVAGAEVFAPLADYLVVNVSSPNTPGLRDLQGKAALSDLLGQVRETVKEACPDQPPPLLVKVAPDLTETNVTDIAETCLETGIDGLIATNTTLARPETLRSSHRNESGGLSGVPLMEPSTSVLAQFFVATNGKLPLVGVGGVASGADAYRKIRAGASLVQLYSALVYGGPELVEQITADLASHLRADGFAHVADAVGVDAAQLGSLGS